MGSTRDKVKRVFRKTVKWGGAALTVLLVVVWIGSAWVAGGLECTDETGVGVSGGRLLWVEPLASWGTGMSHEVVLGRSYFPMRWWFETGLIGSHRCVCVPIWLPALLSLLATAAAWRADAKYLRRVREGACPACGYDRAGLAAGAVCPECGKQPEAR